MFSIAAFQSDMWREFSLAVSRGMENIARQVQHTALGSKADSKVRSYLSGFKRWKRSSSLNGIPSIPANPFQVAVYLQCTCLMNEANSPSLVPSAVYSMDWTKQLAGLPKISDHPLISGLIRASHRILGKSIIKKEP